MEIIEVVVYIFVAMAVGAVILGFIVSFDFMGAQNSIMNIFKSNDATRFESVAPSDIVGKLLSFQIACEEIDKPINLTLHLKSGSLTKTSFFTDVKELYLCDSFRSESEGCGQGEYFKSFDDVNEGELFIVECLGPRIFDLRIVS